MMLASELGPKYATQNYPSQGTPNLQVARPQHKTSQIFGDIHQSVSIIVSWITEMFQLAGYFSEIFTL